MIADWHEATGHQILADAAGCVGQEENPAPSLVRVTEAHHDILQMAPGGVSAEQQHTTAGPVADVSRPPAGTVQATLTSPNDTSGRERGSARPGRDRSRGRLRRQAFLAAGIDEVAKRAHAGLGIRCGGRGLIAEISRRRVLAEMA
jgi:hypothetical protein